MPFLMLLGLLALSFTAAAQHDPRAAAKAEQEERRRR
jgi:hypothetical protein